MKSILSGLTCGSNVFTWTVGFANFSAVVAFCIIRKSFTGQIASYLLNHLFRGGNDILWKFVIYQVNLYLIVEIPFSCTHQIHAYVKIGILPSLHDAQNIIHVSLSYCPPGIY